MTVNTFTASQSINEGWRLKYLTNTLQVALRNALVCEAICQVDRTESKYIASPYASLAETATVQTLAGTYTPKNFTVTDDTLTVADEVIYSEHIYGFESILSNFDLFANRVDDITNCVATAIDLWVLNMLTEDCTGTYDTPTGGFTTAGNFITILGALCSKVAGYADAYKGLFLVVENTDLAGIIPAMGSNGFSMADAALKNGFMNSYMGVDIYVVRTGTFCDAAGSTVSGASHTWTNSGHRVFGVKGVATYAAPRGIVYEEKGRTGYTGKEIVLYGLVGFKLWTPKANLVVDITIT